MIRLKKLFTGSQKKKRDRELRFWAKLLSTKGGPAGWKDVYFRLYCHYLEITQDSFRDEVVVDIGCGPHGALGRFDAAIRIGIDPLIRDYHRLFDLSQHDTVYLACPAENIPLNNETADVVVSRNALDHVEDPARAVNEIHRILRRDGEIVLSVNYQEAPSRCEPHVFTDTLLQTLLKGRFSYEIVNRFPKNHDSGIGQNGQFVYPHEIVLLKGRKITTIASRR